MTRPRRTAPRRAGRPEEVSPAVEASGSRHGPARALPDDDGPCFVGIDPGFDGAVVFLLPGAGGLAEPAPVIRTRGEPTEFDRERMVRLLEGAGITLAAIERVDGNPRHGRRQGTTSMFRFGAGFGMWLGIMEALGVPYVEVPPQTWKKVILKGMGRPGDDDPKAAAIEYCRRFHPDISLIPFGRRVEHSGIADAVCLAEYARRAWRERELIGGG